MTRKQIILVALLVVVAAAGLVVAQESLKGTAFQVETQIGIPLPGRLIYDPIFQRYAEIDVYGALHLVDGATFERQHTLYNEGGYNDFAFSHDGRWLALAIEQRIELWNAETGEKVASLIDLSEAKRIHGPLQFSEDDELLLFSGTYSAPQALRRFEGDTSEVPWLWHLPAAREEGDSPFPNQLEALPFYDYRNGFVMGPDKRIVAALPGRLHVIDAMTIQVLYEIETARWEQDPLTVWLSDRDRRIYVQPVDQSSLIQVDTQRGVLVEFPLSQSLTLDDLVALGGLELGQQTGVIGRAATTEAIPLLNRLIGEYYRDYYVTENGEPLPLTVTLIDFIVPPSNDNSQLQALLFIFDETNQVGTFTLNAFNYFINQMTLSPDGEQLLVRVQDYEIEQLELYDLQSGKQLLSVIPIIRGSDAGSTYQRVLTYTEDGSTIISDYERLDARTLQTQISDLRYSTRFDRFYFTADSQKVVTLSGTEWRLWDLATGEVLRREVLLLNGNIQDEAEDGSRFLTTGSYDDGRGNSGVFVETLDVNSGERQNLPVPNLPGRWVEQIIPNSTWQYFLIVYSTNSYGAYSPGNEVALWGIKERQQLYFYAGDDLPSPSNRGYGWVDEQTAYVYGEEQSIYQSQPSRIFGAAFEPSGVPTCLMERYPDRAETWATLWDQALLQLRSDTMALLALELCEALDSPAQIEQRLLDIATPRPSPSLTPIVLPGVPVCLTGRFPYRAEEFAADWRRLTEGLDTAERAEMERLLCEGIGESGQIGQSNEVLPFTMLLNVVTGERQTGSFAPTPPRRPLQPILEEFLRTEERRLSSVVLSPDEQRIAASGLPGELIIYRLVTSYRTLLDRGTATANSQLATANLIGVMPSATPTPGLIGTARPTLTPTMTVTPPPRPEQAVAQERAFETENLCPAETLYTMDNLPDGYTPSGRLLGPVQGDALWSINPESGRRNPDPAVPACNLGLDCRVSPDQQWVLIWGINEIYVIRPDGSDARTLFKAEKPEDTYNWPNEIYWSGANTLEWEVYAPHPDNPNQFAYQLQRDILGVFPDPPLFLPELTINGRPATIVSRQPGGDWLVAYTTFSTGFTEGYQYFLYNTATRMIEYFARLSYYPAQTLLLSWHPLGDRLLYGYPDYPDIDWYQYTVTTGEHRRLNSWQGGIWSPDGRYRVRATEYETQPVAVWDSQTGLDRTYCIPETGARLYEGPFIWSPDSRYIALQTNLPKDELDEGVGRHVLILDVETGSVTDLTFGGGDLFLWINDRSGS